ncbi:uncharacterized protein B0J16DRAFT_294808 [Fusarium flagelliforme]|uniref:uncharacterized protein n=1 Tax=Fusarium flagelliforme TaxID=2675880 RepID=UPI001E8D759E|nr:uncharacterized protein B0J16DRAFT_294808 [Fusarium flagelliforme]KAH7169823.1 hypothetical protein B0J16DRAFT_294808 [Fusarium flagelliforme]
MMILLLLRHHEKLRLQRLRTDFTMIRAVPLLSSVSTSAFVVQQLLVFIAARCKICLHFLRAMELNLNSATHKKMDYLKTSSQEIQMTPISTRKSSR